MAVSASPSRRDDLRRRIRETSGRGRKLRGLLVLDDATSSVDASTEQAIKVALQEVMAGRTTFVIAHRLSTIALAQEIVVLEGGTVAARGTHDELLGQSDLYREIVEKGLPDTVFLTRKPVEREVAGF